MCPRICFLDCNEIADGHSGDFQQEMLQTHEVHCDASNPTLQETLDPPPLEHGLTPADTSLLSTAASFFPKEAEVAIAIVSLCYQQVPRQQLGSMGFLLQLCLSRLSKFRQQRCGCLYWYTTSWTVRKSSRNTSSPFCFFWLEVGDESWQPDRQAWLFLSFVDQSRAAKPELSYAGLNWCQVCSLYAACMNALQGKSAWVWEVQASQIKVGTFGRLKIRWHAEVLAHHLLENLGPKWGQGFSTPDGFDRKLSPIQKTFFK